jgi:hypothetical protein
VTKITIWLNPGRALVSGSLPCEPAAQSPRRNSNRGAEKIRRQAIGLEDYAMKRTIIACALLLTGTVGALAGHSNDTYYDLVRPNGQPRSDAIFQADLDSCYGQTGASRYDQDSPAFKQCMLGRKWQWQSVRITRSPSQGRRDFFDDMPQCVVDKC